MANEVDFQWFRWSRNNLAKRWMPELFSNEEDQPTVLKHETDCYTNPVKVPLTYSLDDCIEKFPKPVNM